MGIDRKAVEKMLGRSLDAPAKTKKPVPKSKYRSKSEAAYALQLEARKRAGEIEAWFYEAVTFRIGERCRFTPDFMTFKAGQEFPVSFYELKGKHRFREKGIVKFRAAQSMYPYFQWYLIWV